MLAACQCMENSTSIKVERGLSNPQGGKGSYNKKGATIKAFVLRYIEEGHDVVSADDLIRAISYHGGVRGAELLWSI